MALQASALSGVLLAALLGAACLLGGAMPAAGTPPAQLEQFLAAHAATQEWSWFLASGPVLLVGPWFVGVLTVHLWQASPRHRYVLASGASSALICGALLGAAGISWGLFVYLGAQITSPSLVLVLAESRHFAEGAASFPAAGAVIAYTAASWRRLPGGQTLGALGAIAAGLQLANGIDDFIVDGVTGPLGPASLGAFLAWLVATSIAQTADLGRPRLRRTGDASAASRTMAETKPALRVISLRHVGLWQAAIETLSQMRHAFAESRGHGRARQDTKAGGIEY